MKLFTIAVMATLLAACSNGPAGGGPSAQFGVEMSPREAQVAADQIATSGAATIQAAQLEAQRAAARETDIAMPTHTAIAATVEYNQTVSAMNLHATEEAQALALLAEQTELTREAEAIDREVTREAKEAEMLAIERAENFASTRAHNDLEIARQAQKNDLAIIRSVGWSMFFIVLVVCVALFVGWLVHMREQTNRQAIQTAAEAAVIREFFLETSYGPIHAWKATNGQTVYRQIAPPPHLIPESIEVQEPESSLREIRHTRQGRPLEPVAVTDSGADSRANNMTRVTSLLEATIVWQRSYNGGPLIIPRWDQLPGWNSNSRKLAVDVLVKAGIVDVVPSVGTKIRRGWVNAERLLKSIQDEPELLDAENGAAVPA
jgi:hypothetical protein